MILDDDLIQTVDRVSKQLRTSDPACMRNALRAALARYIVEYQERKHREGYERNPVTADEFSVWESEQIWRDEAQ